MSGVSGARLRILLVMYTKTEYGFTPYRGDLSLSFSLVLISVFAKCVASIGVARGSGPEAKSPQKRFLL